MTETNLRDAAARIFDADEVEGVLTSRFYNPGAAARAKPVATDEDKPTHYKVICISMYTEDLERLDKMVENLKARGLTKANRSALIRYALNNINLDNVPKGL